ncbi:MAG TPA: NAD(P)-dependent oxidoreductase [Dehalococcoidia bacterium]|jgi:3-hydroxyisobutyrate dehydrogenase-like beta-hydroxyacid dehydrogenase|nr:NAD(P)-dependent oxidoreductase [Dehalococcoidia bacterium]
MKIGFIGTGNMGNGMVRKLMNLGHELTVNDRRQESTANLIELGAKWADSPADAAKGNEVVISSLPGPAEVDEVVLGERGLLEGAAPGLIYVDLTSSLPTSVKRLGHILESRGVTFIEAPVSGMVSGVTSVEEESLATFVGGDEKAFEQVKPLLAAFCANIFYVGEVGRGNVIKLTNNMISLGSRVLIQEALAVAVKAGFDPMQVYEMWNVSSASRWVQDVPRLLEMPDEVAHPSFSLLLSAKDVGCCLEVSRELGVPMTVGAAVSQVFTRTVAAGLGGHGPAATFLTIEKESGVRIRKLK